MERKREREKEREKGGEKGREGERNPSLLPRVVQVSITKNFKAAFVKMTKTIAMKHDYTVRTGLKNQEIQGV